MNHHQVEEVYECEVCLETFKYLKDLKSHITQEHTSKFEILEIEEIKVELEEVEENNEDEVIEKDNYFGEEPDEDEEVFYFLDPSFHK